MIKARQYQIDAVSSIYEYFQGNGGNPVVAMPTGTGKSVVISMFVESVVRQWPGQRIMVLTHVKELIKQNHDKLKTYWRNAPAGIYSSGLNRRDRHEPVIFAGIASVANKHAAFGHVDLVIIDECHLVSPNQETYYQKFLAGLKQKNPNLKVIGFTATPWRLGMGHITTDGIFTDVCFDITTMQEFNKLVEAGYLAPLIPKHPRNVLDISGVHMRGGEFIESELQKAVDKEAVTAAALQELLEYGADRNHWLVFASGVEHAQHICDALNDLGVPTTVIHGGLSGPERDKRLDEFKAGAYRCAVNNNILTTGFDFPGIDLIGILRPTMSTVLWVQMLGRGTRPAPGKDNCLVLDFAGNTGRLGPVNDPVIPRKKGQKGGEAPIKICGMCSTYNHASARNCICCGKEFSFEVKIKTEASTAELMKVDLPIVEKFDVSVVNFRAHHKEGRPPMVRVTYYCGLRSFDEYVCPEHLGFAKMKANEWWKLRSNEPMPESTEVFLAKASRLKTPQQLMVWTNKKHPEITGAVFAPGEPMPEAQSDFDDVPF